MQPSPTTIALIGRGKIGAQVAEGLAKLPGYRLVAVIGRDANDLPAAQITIDTAGPGALRHFGKAALSGGELWTVGAAALIDQEFRETLMKPPAEPATRCVCSLAGYPAPRFALRTCPLDYTSGNPHPDWPKAPARSSLAPSPKR